MPTQEQIILDMSKTERKIEKAKAAIPATIVRFILSGIVAVWFWNNGDASLPFFDRLMPIFALIFCVYFLCWMFVFCLRLTRNYIVGTIVTLLGVVGVTYLLNYIGSASAFWGNVSAVVFFLAFLGMFFFDIYRLVTLPSKMLALRKIEKEYAASGVAPEPVIAIIETPANAETPEPQMTVPAPEGKNPIAGFMSGIFGNKEKAAEPAPDVVVVAEPVVITTEQPVAEPAIEGQANMSLDAINESIATAQATEQQAPVIPPQAPIVNIVTAEDGTTYAANASGEPFATGTAVSEPAPVMAEVPVVEEAPAPMPQEKPAESGGGLGGLLGNLFGKKTAEADAPITEATTGTPVEEPITIEEPATENATNEFVAKAEASLEKTLGRKPTKEELDAFIESWVE